LSIHVLSASTCLYFSCPFLFIRQPPPRSTLFPYTTLFRSTLAERPTTASCRVWDKFIQRRRWECMDAGRFGGYTRAIRRWFNSILPCRERREVVCLGRKKLRR